VDAVGADARFHAGFQRHLTFSEDFLAKYKGLVFQIRSEGVSVSDRRVVKLLKLFAASAIFDGRSTACDGDFFILKHIWNNLEQAELLEEIVNPVVDAYYRDRPGERRFLGPQANLDSCCRSSGSSARSWRGGPSSPTSSSSRNSRTSTRSRRRSRRSRTTRRVA
jgi:hypothetical protein